MPVNLGQAEEEAFPDSLCTSTPSRIRSDLERRDSVRGLRERPSVSLPQRANATVRERTFPRSFGMMQKAQRRLQPSDSFRITRVGRARVHAGIFFGVNESGLIDVGAFRKRRAHFDGFAVRIEKLGDAMILAGSDEEIDFGHLVFEFFRIALRKAARCDENFAFAAFFELRHIENRFDRFFFGGLDE